MLRMPSRTNLNKNGILQNCILFVAAVVLVIIIAVLYTQSEHYFYFWDNGGFFGVTSLVTDTFAHSLRSGLSMVYHSMDLEYNNLFVIPLLPFTLIFGTSRLVYILAIACMYLLPTALVIGWIVKKLSNANSKFVFWLAVFVTILTPMSWTSVLRGYADMGGALLLLFGLLLFLSDLEFTHPWQIILVGVFFAAGPIFRRPFSYFSVAFYLCAGLFYLFAFIQFSIKNHTFQWNKLLGEWLRLFLAGAVSGLVFFIFARPFLLRLLTTNYSELYSSYTLPVSTTLDFFLREYGWLAWILAAIGLVSAYWSRAYDRQKTLFIAFLGFYCVIQWSVLVRQIGIQYSLQALFLIVIGLMGLALVLMRNLKSWVRFGIGVGMAVLGIFNFLNSLFFPQTAPLALSAFFAYPYGPLVRTDYNQVVDLVAYLRNLPSPHNNIYVVDSSSLMNYDLLNKAEASIYGKDLKLGFLVTPQIDSRDYYPLEDLVQAQTVIFSSPFQHHLDPAQQKVVKFVFDAFTQKSEFAQDFIQMPQTFALEGGVTLYIYRRVRPTTLETSVRTFDALVNYIPEKPGEQLDWMILDSNPGGSIQNPGAGSYQFQISTDGLTSGKTFLRAEPVTIPGKLTGDISFQNAQCPGANLTLEEYSSSGTTVNTATKEVAPNAPSFEIAPFPTQQAGDFLAFEVSRIPAASLTTPCDLSVSWRYTTP